MCRRQVTNHYSQCHAWKRSRGNMETCGKATARDVRQKVSGIDWTAVASGLRRG